MSENNEVKVIDETSVGELRELIKEQVEFARISNHNITQVINAVSHIGDQLMLVSEKVDKFDDRFNSLDNRMNRLELHEEITTDQVKDMKSAVCARCYELLKPYTSEPNKYIHVIIPMIYSAAKRESSMGNEISRTRKEDYDRVMEYILRWYPVKSIRDIIKEYDYKESNIVA